MRKGDRVRYVPPRHKHSRWATVVEVRADMLVVIRDGKFETVPLSAVKEIEEVLYDA
ncbi:MAG: hypothetical protein ABFC80_03810 [Coriobacteriales bacterium]